MFGQSRLFLIETEACHTHLREKTTFFRTTPTTLYSFVRSDGESTGASFSTLSSRTLPAWLSPCSISVLASTSISPISTGSLSSTVPSRSILRFAPENPDRPAKGLTGEDRSDE